MSTYYYTTDQVKRAHEARGGRFFSPANMRAFRSRVGSEVYGGRYFITSEKEKDKSPRRYTVREIRDSADIMTVGKVMQHASWQQARREISKIINGGPENKQALENSLERGWNEE
jgi:hypothetical protein